MSENEPQRYWSDTSVSASDVETVRAGVCARFEGEARDELLGMLLDGVQVREATETAPRALRSKEAGMSETISTAETAETSMKPKRGPAVAPTASGRTKAQLAAIREWAIANGVRHTTTGRMPRATIAAYDAAHAATEARTDEAPKPTRPRKLVPMKPVDQPPALSEPAPRELAAVAEAVKVAVVHGPVLPDMETRAALYNDGFADAEEAYAPAVDDTLRAEAALEFVLRAWDAERTRRRGQSALLRSMARQVILAEQERRADADTLAGMDRALADAHATIEDLQAQLEQAHAEIASPWWRRWAS